MSGDEAKIYVQDYGEEARRLIQDALKFLDDQEQSWGLDEPIDRDEYIKELLTLAGWMVKP